MKPLKPGQTIHIDRLIFPKKQRLPRKLKKELKKGRRRILIYYCGKPLFIGSLSKSLLPYEG